MADQPKALRLAQGLNNRQECEDDAADELRRLYEENQSLRAALAQAEPLAWVDERAISWLAGRRGKASAHVTTTLSAAKSLERPMALYTAPPRAEPVDGIWENGNG